MTKKISLRMSAWCPSRGALAAIALLSLVACKGRSSLPQLVFSADSVEIGTVYKDNPYADFDIEYRNEGSQRLSVYRITTSCGCTEVLSVDSFIEPDGVGHIKGRLDMKDRPPGDFAEELVIFSDGSEKPVHYYLYGELRYKQQK